MKVTSGGMDNGARPIWDARAVEAEKHRVEDGKDGRRKAGREADGAEQLIARSRALERVVESIAVCWVCTLTWEKMDLEDSKCLGGSAVIVT